MENGRLKSISGSRISVFEILSPTPRELPVCTVEFFKKETGKQLIPVAICQKMNTIRRMATKYPFQNLVFQGGGVRVLAYHGAIQALENHGILPQIERVAGTSGGAMTATLVSFRLSAQKTIDLFNTINLREIPRRRSIKDISWNPPRALEPQLNRLIANWDALSRLLDRYGWYGNERGFAWVEQVIASQCEGNGRATFAEFRARGFRDLYVVATNISTRSAVVFCYDNTPDVAVADAVVMSQSIPLFFEAVQFDGKQIGKGDYFADGGVLNNYPLQIFDFNRYVSNEKWFVNGVNWETLGCRLFTPPDCPRQHRPITNVLAYLSSLLDTVKVAQDVAYSHNRVDQWRSVEISDCCVSVFDFGIHPQPGNTTYDKLYASGKTAVDQFIAQYVLPTPDQIAQIRQMFNRVWPLRHRET